jgi:hypothetical protein
VILTSTVSPRRKLDLEFPFASVVARLILTCVCCNGETNVVNWLEPVMIAVAVVLVCKDAEVVVIDVMVEPV